MHCARGALWLQRLPVARATGTAKKSGSTIAVKFRLALPSGAPLPAATAAALAAGGNVKITPTGPGSATAIIASSICEWSAANAQFQCKIKTQGMLASGPANPYQITAYENIVSGFVVAPPVGTAVNPTTVFFK